MVKPLGDVSKDYALSVLSRYGIHLRKRRNWCVLIDSAFAVRVADIVGLFLEPAENAGMLCVDENPDIQTLERAQGCMQITNHRAQKRGDIFMLP